jgi:hypothetical protein
VYHQFGSCGGSCACEPVFTSGVHSRGVIWSTFSFRYLASLVISAVDGTSYGVGNVFSPWVFPSAYSHASYKAFHFCCLGFLRL